MNGSTDQNQVMHKSGVSDDVGSKHDVGERLDAKRLLSIQHDFAVGLVARTNLLDCLSLLLTTALRLPDFDCGAVFLCDEAGDGIQLLSQHGFSVPFAGNDAAYAATEGLKLTTVLPLRDANTVMATLYMASHQLSRVDPNSMITLESLVAQAEGSIACIRARGARHIAEKRLRLAVEGANLGTWAADFDNQVFEASDLARELHGIALDLPLSKESVIRTIHPEDQQKVTSALERSIQQGECLLCDYRTTLPTGEKRWLTAQARVCHEGEGRVLYGIVRDITHSKCAENALIEARDHFEMRVAVRTAELEQANAALRAESVRLERALAELRQSERKYRELHDSMMDAFVRLSLDGFIIESNRAFQQMIGYTQEELRRLTSCDITPKKWHAMEDAIIHDQILARGFSDLYEKEYQRPDGTVFSVEMRVLAMRDEMDRPTSMWAIIRDISGRKIAEQTMIEWNRTLERRVEERNTELQLSESRFRQLVEASFEGIGISVDGILVDGNPRLAELHGYELSEMIGRPVLDFVAPESRMMVADHLEEAIEIDYECFGLRKDGSLFPEEVHARIMDCQGKVMRVTTLRDLTIARQAAAEQHALQRELQRAHKISLISEISTGVIHQIGQPLSAMGANLAAIIATASSCPLHNCDTLEIIKDVNADLSRLRDLVAHLRALANPARANKVKFDFNAMVGDVLRLLRIEAVNRQINLVHELDDKLPLMDGDSVQLSQVVLNLTRNAFDACAVKPISRRLVEIRTRLLEDDLVELRVKDTGTGIAQESMKALFTPFFTTKPDGLGMGLRLCRTIVESHGGFIEANNNTDSSGAVFRVILSTNTDYGYSKV